MLRPLAPLSSDQVGDNIVILFKRHAKELASVLDAGLGMYASGIREGTLPKSCAIVLAVSETYRGISEPRIGTPLPTHSPAENGRNKPLLKPEEARAATVQALINELNVLKPQRLRTKPNMTAFAAKYPHFLAFQIAEERGDLRRKLMALQGSPRHIRLAQELAAAHHGKALSTILHDWSHHKTQSSREKMKT